MQILKVQHEDFILQVESHSFRDVLIKARQNLAPDALKTFYKWSDGVSSVSFSAGNLETPVHADDKLSPPVFFDNTNYAFWVDFKNRPSDVQLQTKLKIVEENFTYHHGKGIFSGFINYGNDIGKSDFSITYMQNNVRKHFRLDYEVLSSKLDYHSHWRKIVDDVENEYLMLAFDFLRKTYHSFAIDPEGVNSALIWWNLFKNLQTSFIQACRLILSAPRKKNIPNTAIVKADRLKKLTPQLENEFIHNRQNREHCYRFDNFVLAADTTENRFFKHALFSITRQHNLLAGKITSLKITDTARSEIDSIRKDLTGLCSHPFFRTIGEFKTLNQESLVLQRAPGYATVSRTWAILKAAYSLNDGMSHLETKDIATLYEIWCFIQVKNMVKKLYGSSVAVDDANRTELSYRFKYDLETGEQSKVVFRKDGQDLAELFFNPKTSEKFSNGIKDTIIPTGVPQKPDIVLQLDRILGGDNNFKLTYLFDAKYRIADKTGNGVDTPPDDSINQMHRYRDAIYYCDSSRAYLCKEVVGGYILFPGTGDPLNIQRTSFFKSIEKVNIGAFPLRPCDEENQKLLEHFLASLIVAPAETHIKKTIPQKGTFLQLDTVDALRQATLYGTIHGGEQLEWIHKSLIYNLPLSEAGLQGIKTGYEAAQKHWLVLTPPMRSKDRRIRVYKIQSFVGLVDANDFYSNYSYFHRPTYPQYYLWKLKPAGEVQEDDILPEEKSTDG